MNVDKEALEVQEVAKAIWLSLQKTRKSALVELTDCEAAAKEAIEAYQNIIGP